MIFVEVALVSGIAGNIHALLDEAAPIGNPQTADTAIFYSISNCQRGLAGISFGDFLIKRVVDALATELPRLKAHSTLSPIPGFRAWLKGEAERGRPLLLPAEARAVEGVRGESPTRRPMPSCCGCSMCLAGTRMRASRRCCASR